jgi:hypothetical protein
MKTPDEHVGENIIAELKKQGLLSKAALEKLKRKLISGSFSSLDWKLIFETDRPMKKESNEG